MKRSDFKHDLKDVSEFDDRIWQLKCFTVFKVFHISCCELLAECFAILFLVALATVSANENTGSRLKMTELADSFDLIAKSVLDETQNYPDILRQALPLNFQRTHDAF